MDENIILRVGDNLQVIIVYYGLKLRKVSAKVRVIVLIDQPGYPAWIKTGPEYLQHHRAEIVPVAAVDEYSLVPLDYQIGVAVQSCIVVCITDPINAFGDLYRIFFQIKSFFSSGPPRIKIKKLKMFIKLYSFINIMKIMGKGKPCFCLTATGLHIYFRYTSKRSFFRSGLISRILRR